MRQSCVHPSIHLEDTRKSGENPAQYPLLYWRSGVPVCVAKVTAGRCLWEGGTDAAIPKPEYSLSDWGYGNMTGYAADSFVFVAPGGIRQLCLITACCEAELKSPFYEKTVKWILSVLIHMVIRDCHKKERKE